MLINKKLKQIALGIATSIGLLVIPVVASASTHYTVQLGDSLWAISQNYKVSLNSLVTSNPTKLFSINSTIYPNEVLIVNSNSQGTTYQTAPTTNYTAPATKTYQAPTQSTNTQTTSNGSVAEQAAQLMEQKTGVSASEWLAISYRESRNNPTAQNPGSTAHGLYQSLYTTSNDWREQVNDAARIYHQQGMNAWALTR